jgi:hypothetical protein
MGLASVVADTSIITLSTAYAPPLHGIYIGRIENTEMNEDDADSDAHPTIHGLLLQDEC